MGCPLLYSMNEVNEFFGMPRRFREEDFCGTMMDIHGYTGGRG